MAFYQCIRSEILNPLLSETTLGPKKPIATRAMTDFANAKLQVGPNIKCEWEYQGTLVNNNEHNTIFG
ncbi:hypothetical protein CBI36_08070 [Acetobacter oryzifermentans]|uniref:Uncharacterized protein n=1 Tax=Acetobacter oryzifermentans TaxID=1633874 RepID=A0ABC8CFL4_9PROT|nr:hypothetical protein CBI36_08070 [Acetobacter oryzifermentans]